MLPWLRLLRIFLLLWRPPVASDVRHKEQPPRDIEEEFLAWGDGWRYPRLASYDPETGEFFDPDSCATYDDVTY